MRMSALHKVFSVLETPKPSIAGGLPAATSDAFDQLRQQRGPPGQLRNNDRLVSRMGTFSYPSQAIQRGRFPGWR